MSKLRADQLPLAANLIVSGGLLAQAPGTDSSSGTLLADGDYGDVTVSGTGTVITIDSGAVTNSKLASGIDASKLADGTVSNTEFQHLNGVTSAIQTQLTSLQSQITELASMSSDDLTAQVFG